MKRVMLAMLGAAAVLALVAAPAAQADEVIACHTDDGTCECTGGIGDETFTATLTGTPSEAKVQAFESPSKARAVSWSRFVMSGETDEGATISATLDPARISSGTVLSLGNKKFPATATMRFFLRLETNGLTLVSTQPAVFQGIIHSIPPGSGDKLTLISGPVKFHAEGDPSRVVMATLNTSTVAFGERNKPKPSQPVKAGWGMAGVGAVLFVSGGLYLRRRSLPTA